MAKTDRCGWAGLRNCVGLQRNCRFSIAHCRLKELEEVMVISDLPSRLRALFRRKPMGLDEDAHFERGVGSQPDRARQDGRHEDRCPRSV